MASYRFPGVASVVILLLLAVAIAADEAFTGDDDGPGHFTGGEFETSIEAPPEVQEVNSIALLKSQQTFQQTFQQSFYSSVGHPVVLETLLKTLLRFQQSY